MTGVTFFVYSFLHPIQALVSVILLKNIIHVYKQQSCLVSKMYQEASQLGATFEIVK